MRTRYFTVRYDPSDPYLAKIMAGTAEDNLLRISRRLGYRPDSRRPFRLRVYPTHLGFIEAGGLETSKFTVGTTGPHDVVSVDASGTFVPPEEVMAHEITHAVIFRLLGPNTGSLPLWLNEGLAVYYSKDFFDEEDQLVADAAAEGVLIPLNDLAREFPQQRTPLAYAESASAARYLISAHGASAPQKLFAALASGDSLDRAMEKAGATGSDAFESDWYAWATRKYWQLRALRIGGAIVSALMAVLAILAFLVRRKQKIEAAKRWEQEEFEEHLRRQLGNDWWR